MLREKTAGLTTLKENVSNEDREVYVDFCRSVFRTLLSHGELASHSCLSQHIDWGRGTLRRDIDP